MSYPACCALHSASYKDIVHVVFFITASGVTGFLKCCMQDIQNNADTIKRK